MSPLGIASGGYIRLSPIGAATDGYINITFAPPIVLPPSGGGITGRRARELSYLPDVEVKKPKSNNKALLLLLLSEL